jgi:hypothetical protein
MNSNIIYLLLKRQWLENRKAWSIGLLSIASLLAFLFFLIWHWRTSFNGDTVRGVFLLMLFGGGVVYISSIFKDLGNKQKGIWLLILPASAFQKLAVALFYGVIVYLAAYLTIFYGVKEIALLVLSDEATLFSSFDLLKNDFYYFIFTFVNIQSVTLLGSVYFNRSQLLKTVLLLITALFLVFNLNGLFLEILTKEQHISSSIPLGGFQFVSHGENTYVYTSGTVAITTSILLRAVVPLALWFITWLLIKEKQL